MYVTRTLSQYKSDPAGLSRPPPEGPNSGYLVVQDEESMKPCCFGLGTSDVIDDIPLPSNKVLKFGDDSDDDNEIFAVPVINQPLSANRYYAIKVHRSCKGGAYASSREEDEQTGCCGRYIRDQKPRFLDPEDLYQQFEFSTSSITCSNTIEFTAKSVAPNSHPPSFLRRTAPARLSLNPSKDFIPREANGLNSSLRARLPNLNFTLSRESSDPVLIGKWYCPFMFIHDEKPKEQVKKSMYYEITLEQRWERVYISERGSIKGNKFINDVVVPTEMVAIFGKEALYDETSSVSNVVWFRALGSSGGGQGVGLSSLVMERMIWEQERFGWVNVRDKKVRIVREEVCEESGVWLRCGCYVLVERFVVKRANGSLVLSYDFKHTNRVMSKWD